MTLPLPKAGTGLMTIAFDLDGTLAEATWPEPYIGRPIERGMALLHAYHQDGYEVIIFTSRPASHLDNIKSWLRSHDITFVYNVVTDKPRAAMYIDDRAVTFPEAFERSPVAGSSSQCCAPESRRDTTYFCMERRSHGGRHRFLVEAEAIR